MWQHGYLIHWAKLDWKFLGLENAKYQIRGIKKVVLGREVNKSVCKRAKRIKHQDMRRASDGVNLESRPRRIYYRTGDAISKQPKLCTQNCSSYRTPNRFKISWLPHKIELHEPRGLGKCSDVERSRAACSKENMEASGSAVSCRGLHARPGLETWYWPLCLAIYRSSGRPAG